VLSDDYPVYRAGFQAGSRLAGYRLEEQVGAGGMAVVFRARDERLDRLVALKILAPAIAADPEFRRRFTAESRAAARVDDPHIIPVYEAAESGGVLFIAMRFVSGGDLRRVLRDEGPMQPGRAIELIAPVASALDAAHAAGLVHRDVKPANILVDVRPGRPDHLYLSDFGIAKATLSSARLTEPGAWLGTPDYSPPEQIDGMAVDGRADQYSLACVAFQMLTGVVPFQRDRAMQVMLAHLQAPVPSLAARRPDLPAAADSVLAKAMAKAPEERFQSCGQFVGALREALGLAHQQPGEPAVPPAPAQSHETARPYGSAQTATFASPAAVPPPATTPSPVVTPQSSASAWPSGSGQFSVAPLPTTGELKPGEQRRRGRATRRRAVVSGAAVLAVAAAATAYLTFSGKPAGKTRSVATSGTQVGTVAGSSHDQLFYAAFSRDGATIAGFGGREGSTSTARIYLWTAVSGKLAGTLTDENGSGLGGWPGGLAFTANGKTLIAGDYDGSIHLWDVGTHHASLVGDPDNSGSLSTSILDSDYSPGGELVAEGNNLSNIHLLRLADRQWTGTFKDPTAINEYNHPGRSGSRYYINQVIVDQAGSILAVSDTSGHAYVWSTSGGAPLISTTGLAPAGNAASQGMAFAPDGGTLAVATAGNQGTRLWDLATRQVTATLAGPDTQPEVEAFTPDGGTLAVADADGTIYLWDVAHRRIAGTIRTQITGTDWGGLEFSPDGKTLAVFTSGGAKVTLYKISYTEPAP
jgi:serine/threonine-protein kinase